MDFLKDRRISWKFILLVILLAILVGGGILGYWYFWIQKEEIEVPEFLIPEKETFIVIDYREIPEKHRGVTVYHVSIPLDDF